ncbi:MAG: hypothetical protein IE913_05910 [Halothiobacillus sp.]|nr:hypothetical protein [Halothiobacillus sp.]
MLTSTVPQSMISVAHTAEQGSHQITQAAVVMEEIQTGARSVTETIAGLSVERL